MKVDLPFRYKYVGRKYRQVKRTPQLLHEFGKIALREIRAEIDKTDLKDKDKIKASLKYKIVATRTAHKVVILLEHVAVYQDEGVRRHQMRYIRNRVILIELDDLERPTHKDYQQGVGFRTIRDKAPTHPGIKGRHFIERGVERAREEFIQILIKEGLSQ